MPLTSPPKSPPTNIGSWRHTPPRPRFNRDHTMNINQPQALSNFAFPSQKAKEQIYSLINADDRFPVDTVNGIILYSDVGTGKSTCAAFLPQEMEEKRSKAKPTIHVHNCSPSSNQWAIPNQVRNAAFLASFGGLHYFILDEVSSLTALAQDNLRGTMDIVREHAVFITTTNDISKVNTSVKNRSHCINFETSGPSVFVPIVRTWLEENGVSHQSISDLDIVKNYVGNAASIRQVFAQCSLR
ncbi:hypothetical protein SAMN02787142_2840 [Burkholderia sp. WP9]|nr:hypothetical protein SAMN02787142_2840 [Burkholderia sp. WP9]